MELRREPARLADGLVDVALDAGRPLGRGLDVAGEQVDLDLEPVEDLLEVVVEELRDPLPLAALGLGDGPRQGLDLLGPVPERLGLGLDARLELVVEPAHLREEVPDADLLPPPPQGHVHDGPERDRPDRPLEHGHVPPPPQAVHHPEIVARAPPRAHEQDERELGPVGLGLERAGHAVEARHPERLGREHDRPDVRPLERPAQRGRVRHGDHLEVVPLEHPPDEVAVSAARGQHEHGQALRARGKGRTGVL